MTAQTRTRAGLGSVRWVGALALVVVALAGCGGDDPDGTATDPAGATSSATASPTESASEAPVESEKPKEPQCADVWVEGAKLPGNYQDCYEGDQRVKADGRYCEFGKPLITYDSSFWAVPGGIVHEVDGELLDDAKYRDSLHKCSG